MGQYRVCAVGALIGLFFLFVPADSRGCDGAPWLSLEIHGAEVGAGAPVETIVVDADGCIASAYPPFDRRAGEHHRQLGGGERSVLQQLVVTSGVLTFDAAAARAQLRMLDHATGTRAGPRVFHVADAEMTRLIVHHGTLLRMIEWPSPEVEYALRGRPAALRPLVTVVERLRLLGTPSAAPP
jgi:hypothetical protein